ncbi:hypothetical protein V4U36_000652 [Pseudomonas aeruginosa]
MDMFEVLGRIKDGELTSTRGMDVDDECSLRNLMHDGYLTGTKTGKGYVALKLTEKGEQAVAFGRTPISEFLPKPTPWWEHPLARWLGVIATALIIAFLTFYFGWN